jgi:hypothetical protein
LKYAKLHKTVFFGDKMWENSAKMWVLWVLWVLLVASLISLRPHLPHAENSANSAAPLVVCLHGLNGSVSSFAKISPLGCTSRAARHVHVTCTWCARCTWLTHGWHMTSLMVAWFKIRGQATLFLPNTHSSQMGGSTPIA